MREENIPTYSIERLPSHEPSAVGSSYGDREIAAAFCGLGTTPLHFAGEWQHGWIWKEYNCHPEMILGSDGLTRQRKSARYFVARADQVDALRTYGYTDVHAIGLPMVYLERPNVERIKGSLLVLPSHSLAERNENWDGAEYARYLAPLGGGFSRVGLCLARSCVAKGYWKALHPLANDIYVGASVQDRNSLARLALLFSSYEYVTTTDIGSHVCYAAYFGAKVSVAGPRVAWENVNASASTLYRNCPECAPIMKRVKARELFAAYPQFCVEPAAAAEHVDWARWQLGEQHKRTPRELRRLFGWSVPQRALHLAKRATAPTGYMRFARMAWPLVRTLGIPGLVAALQLRTAARRTTGSSRIWCGWKRRLSLRNGSTDLDVFEQHFARRELLDIRFAQEASTIVDLGANVGISVEVLRRLFPRARIVAVELEAGNAELCRANHRFDGRVSILTGAIWPEPGRVRVKDVGDGAWAFRAAPSGAGEAASVPAFTYRQILDMHQIQTVDVLKMDIEGAEAEVLERAWNEIFRSTAVAIIEVHDWIDGVEARVTRVVEQAKKRFDLDISRSGEFLVIRNRALAGT
jgi:FkbM family methyltransferase